MAIRGVAIIMMVLYHIFYVATFHSFHAKMFLYIGNVPVLERLSETFYPVSLFVMITGYGLALAYEKKMEGTKICSKKIYKYPETISLLKKVLHKSLKLFVRLWLVYLLVLPIAIYMYPEIYPNSLSTLILNLLNIDTSYNVSEWFLLPYLLIVLISEPILTFVFNFKSIYTIVLSLFILGVYLLVYKNVGLEEITRCVTLLGLKVYLALGLIFPFCLGALAYKHSLPNRIFVLLNKIGHNSKWIAVSLVVILIITRCFIHNQSIQPLSVFVLFIFFPSLRLSRTTMNVLSFLGKHSVVIWFIHTWYSENLFSKYIYNLKYPFLIFLAVMGLSIVSSLIIEYICKKILCRI